MNSVLEMSGKIGARARFIRHVMSVYRAVILRPKFGAKEHSSEWAESDFPKAAMIFSVGDDKFILQVCWSSSSASVYCTEIKLRPVSFDLNPVHARFHPTQKKFIFTESHNAKTSGKVKKSALLLMKKIEHKPVYDLMNS
jgi:hypothetical protein